MKTFLNRRIVYQYFYLKMFRMIPPADRETMNKQQVLYREAKTVLTLPSLESQKRLRCDGITLNLGDACAYSCEFCYVGAAMTKNNNPLLDLHNGRNGSSLGFSGVVIRRRNPIGLLRGQRVVYSSTLVDVAANMALLLKPGNYLLLQKRNALAKRIALRDSVVHSPPVDRRASVWGRSLFGTMFKILRTANGRF